MDGVRWVGDEQEEVGLRDGGEQRPSSNERYPKRPEEAWLQTARDAAAEFDQCRLSAETLVKRLLEHQKVKNTTAQLRSRRSTAASKIHQLSQVLDEAPKA